jgi:hypothetical protein
MNEPRPPHPTFNAMLICDNTIREEGTGKISLIGIFGVVYSPAFPAVHPSLCVYLNIADALGRYRLRLDLMQADSMRVIGRGEGELEVTDRERPAEFVFQLLGLAFEGPGRYQFNLYANNELLGSKSFNVVLSKQPPGGA